MQAILNGNPLNLNNEILPLTLYGFGIYSSFILSNGRLVLGWDHHIARIQSDALQFLGLKVEREDIVRSVQAFVEGKDTSWDMACRITVFPGDFNLGAPQLAETPRLLVTGGSGSSLSGKSLNLQLTECDRPFAQHKITNISAAMKSRARAKAANFDDALFTAQDHITEGPTWNVFFIKGHRVVTPPINGLILPGVTRRILIDILDRDIEEKPITVDNLSDFDGAFATNAAIGVVPIRSIEKSVYSEENEIITRLQETYQAYPKTIIS